MKTLLTVFSLVWLLSGVALLALVIMYPDMLPVAGPAPVAPDAQTPSLQQEIKAWLPMLAAAIWVVLFLMPALGLAALGAVLDKLQRLEINASQEAGKRERAEPGRKRPVTEKVEPTIGEL